MSEDDLEIFNSYLPSAYKQGDVGEVLTASELRNLGFRVLRNLYFPHDNRFTEIDMIGISPYGIFIVENKNYSGVVSGSIDDKYWTVRYSSMHKERLYNPVNQNILHKNIVSNYVLKEFDFDDRYIFRPVIFNDKCKLNLRGTEKDVFTLSNFRLVYYSYVECRKEVISSDNQLKLYEFFAQFSNISELMRLLHIVLLKGG